MKQVKINGKTLNIECNFLALSAYERITEGSAFDLNYVNTNKLTATVTMAYCMLLANNQANEVGDLNEFMSSLKNMEDVNELIKIVNDEATAFFKVLPGDQKNGKRKKGDKEGND